MQRAPSERNVNHMGGGNPQRGHSTLQTAWKHWNLRRNEGRAKETDTSNRRHHTEDFKLVMILYSGNVVTIETGFT